MLSWPVMSAPASRTAPRGGEGALAPAESRSTSPPTLIVSAARALPSLPGELGAMLSPAMSAQGSRTVPAAVKAPPPGAESRNTSPRTLIASATRALPSSSGGAELGAAHAELPCDVRAGQPDRARGGEGALVYRLSRGARRRRP